jgi:hypothetical protein
MLHGVRRIVMTNLARIEIDRDVADEPLVAPRKKV